MVQRVYRQIKEVDTEASVTIATQAQVSAINNQLGQGIGICVEPCRRDTFLPLLGHGLSARMRALEEEAVVVCPVDPVC